MRRLRSQRGMTLVELLVSLAVASILLVGLGGAMFDVSMQYQRWVDRVDLAAAAGAGLAAALQADSHRYVVCDPFQPDGSELKAGEPTVLHLCLPDAIDPTSAGAAVTYMIGTQAPYVITRMVQGGSTVFMVRSPSPRQPVFWANCIDDGGTLSGHIHVFYLRLDDGAGDTGGDVQLGNFSVYYVAPRPQNGCPT